MYEKCNLLMENVLREIHEDHVCHLKKNYLNRRVLALEKYTHHIKYLSLAVNVSISHH